MQPKWPAAWLIGVTTVAALCGCNRGPTPYPVTGTVTLNGAPLPHGGAIMFRHTQTGATATGGIAADGTFSVTTFKAGDGVLPGDYAVVITPALPPDWNDEVKGPPPRIISAKYNRFETTPLKYTVEAKENRFEIKLDGP